MQNTSGDIFGKIEKVICHFLEMAWMGLSVDTFCEPVSE